MSANVEKRMTLSEIGGIIVPDMGKEKEQGCDYEDSSICDRMERRACMRQLLTLEQLLHMRCLKL